MSATLASAQQAPGARAPSRVLGSRVQGGTDAVGDKTQTRARGGVFWETWQLGNALRGFANPGCRDPTAVAAAALSLSLYQATARLPGASGVRFLARWMRILSPLTDPIWQVQCRRWGSVDTSVICMCVYVLSCMYACILDLASECRQWDSGPASRIRGLHQLRRAAQPTRSWSWRGGDCANSRLRSHLGAQPKGRGHTRLRTYI